MEPQEADKFADELRWCINQLELGLQRQGPDSRQAQDTYKILKILQSKKAPLIKKRQAMRNSLGDYRKKMKEEEKRSLNALKRSKFKSRDNLKVFRRSKFLRHSNTKQIICERQNEASHHLNIQLGGLNLQPFSLDATSLSSDISVPRDESSNVSQEPTENACLLSSTAESTNPGCHNNAPNPESSSLSNQNGMLNTTTTSKELSSRFKFCPSNNSFMFGFGEDNECNKNVDFSMNEKSNGQSDNCLMKDDNSQNMQNNSYSFKKSDNSFSFNF